MKAKIGISNRHVHLTKEDYITLFGKEELPKLRDLHQIGEYAATECVTLENEYGKKEFVRIIGPFRKYTQVELLRSDLSLFKINPPVRRSGDLYDAETITIIGPVCKIVAEKSTIIANVHLHMQPDYALINGFKDREKITCKTADGLLFEGEVKVSDNGYYEVHIDKDEAILYDLQTDDEVEIIRA